MAKELAEKRPKFRPKKQSKPGSHIGQASAAGSKQAVNLSVDAEILAAAKVLGINLSQTLEEELRRRTKEMREIRWREENRKAIESYDRLSEKNGIFGEEFRNW